MLFPRVNTYFYSIVMYLIMTLFFALRKKGVIYGIDRGSIKIRSFIIPYATSVTIGIRKKRYIGRLLCVRLTLTGRSNFTLLRVTRASVLCVYTRNFCNDFTNFTHVRMNTTSIPYGASYHQKGTICRLSSLLNIYGMTCDFGRSFSFQLFYLLCNDHRFVLRHVRVHFLLGPYSGIKCAQVDDR